MLNVPKIYEMKQVIDRRMEHLNYFIKTTVENLINEKIIMQFKRNNVNTSIVSSKLVDALKVSLNCEREQYMRDLTDRLEITTAEKNRLEDQYHKLQKRLTSENSLLSEENMDLRKKYNNLVMKYKALDLKNAHIEHEMSTFKLVQKPATSEQISYIKDIRKANQNLKEECMILKYQYMHFIKRQQKVFKEAATLLRNLTIKIVKNLTKKHTKTLQNICQGHSEMIKSINENYSREIATLNQKHSDKVKNLNNECTETLSFHESIFGSVIKEDNKKIKKVRKCCIELIDTIDHLISGLNLRDKVRDDDDAVRCIQIVTGGIAMMIGKIKENTSNEVKKDIINKFPQYYLSESKPNESVSDMVKRIFDDTIRSREEIYRERFESLEKRERKLRKRLQLPLDTYYGNTSLFDIEDKPESTMSQVDQYKFQWKNHMDSIDSRLSRFYPESK